MISILLALWHAENDRHRNTNQHSVNARAVTACPDTARLCCRVHQLPAVVEPDLPGRNRVDAGHGRSSRKNVLAAQLPTKDVEGCTSQFGTEEGRAMYLCCRSSYRIIPSSQCQQAPVSPSTSTCLIPPLLPYCDKEIHSPCPPHCQHCGTICRPSMRLNLD